MKLNTPEIRNITQAWQRINSILTVSHMNHGNNCGDYFKVIDRNGESVEIYDWTYWYKDPNSSKLAFKIKKNYWAKGRKLKIESKIDGVTSGEYKIIQKATSNSYDQADFLVVEFATPELGSPRKTLNWLERQAAEQEARDGITTEKIIQSMGVR